MWDFYKPGFTGRQTSSLGLDFQIKDDILLEERINKFPLVFSGCVTGRASCV